MSRDRSAKRKSFLAALMLCMVSALGLTVGVVYDKTHSNDKMDIADLNEPLQDEEDTTEEFGDEFMFDDSQGDVSGDVQDDIDGTMFADAGMDNHTHLDNTGAGENTDNTDDGVNEQGMQAVDGAVQGDVPDTADSSVNGEAQSEDDMSEAAAAVSGTVNALHFNTEEKISWPVKGEIILPYSMEDTIFFPTLNVYKCNDALMIKGEKDMPVCAAQEGVVESVSTDREFGNMVVINMGDDYMATYGQLENVQVEEGQSIEKGQQIATLGAPTAYYETEGYNLYFKITQSDKPVNPQDLLE